MTSMILSRNNFYLIFFIYFSTIKFDEYCSYVHIVFFYELVGIKGPSAPQKNIELLNFNLSVLKNKINEKKKFTFFS